MIDPFRCQWRQFSMVERNTTRPVSLVFSRACTALRGMSMCPLDVTSSPIFKGELASEER
jgi:hypothetical protein